MSACRERERIYVWHRSAVLKENEMMQKENLQFVSFMLSKDMLSQLRFEMTPDSLFKEYLKSKVGFYEAQIPYFAKRYNLDGTMEYRWCNNPVALKKYRPDYIKDLSNSRWLIY